MNLPWIVLAVVVAFAAGAVVGEWDGARRVDLRWTTKDGQQAAADERAARAASVANYRNVEVAYAANRLDIEKQRAAAARAERAARGLRNELAAVRRQLAGDSGPACALALDACHAVLGDCGDQYRDVAQAADDHAADAKLCIAGWPK